MLPVDVIDTPRPASQYQDMRAILLAQECRFVYESKLLTPMVYGK